MAENPVRTNPVRTNPVRIVCGNCRSEEVTREAWAEWDAAGQQWVLGAVFDYAYCHRCQGSTQIATIPCEPPPPSGPG